PLGRNALGRLDVDTLGALVAACQHHHEHRATLHEVHPITGSVVDPQLADSAAYRLDVAIVPSAMRSSRAAIRALARTSRRLPNQALNVADLTSSNTNEGV